MCTGFPHYNGIAIEMKLPSILTAYSQARYSYSWLELIYNETNSSDLAYLELITVPEW